MQRCIFITFYLFLAVALLLPGNILLFAANSLSREFEPVVIAGSKLEKLNNAPVDELFLYAFRDNAWQQIPFQIDERDTTGDYFLADGGLLDANDELVFMAKDAGDEAPTTWLDNEESKAFARCAIKVTNPLAVDEAGWVYLYRSTSIVIEPNLPDYIKYDPSATANIGEDKITGASYEMGHGTNGFPNSLKIFESVGGNGADILDVLKLRASIEGFPLTVNETLIKILADQDDTIRFIDGKIRVIRKLDVTFGLPPLFAVAFSVPPLFYNPNSFHFSFVVPSLEDLSPDAKLNGGRMSFDLNSDAMNMKFVSAANPEPGVTVDGNADASLNKEIDDVLPDNNWIYLNGQQGTIVHLFPLAKTVANQRNLYYKDNLATDGLDTGDKMSYGDSGIEISGGVEPPVIFNYKGYYLGSGFDSSIGSTLANYERNPMSIDVSGQTIEEVTTVVLSDPNLPQSISLAQNFPNPFNPTTIIRYEISGIQTHNANVELNIFNLLGEEVRTLVNKRQAPGIYTIEWDGKDSIGRVVTSGIYIYRLTAGKFVDNKKMIFVK